MTDPFAEPSKYDLSAIGYGQQRAEESSSLLVEALEGYDDAGDDTITKEF